MMSPVLMTNRDPGKPDDSGDPQGPDRRRGALMQLLLVLLLVLGGLFLVRALRNMSRLQDCVMSGGSNCAPIHVPPS